VAAPQRHVPGCGRGATVVRWHFPPRATSLRAPHRGPTSTPPDRAATAALKAIPHLSEWLRKARDGRQ